MVANVVTCSYGQSALDALRAVVAHAKGSDPMAMVTVLAPNNRAAIVARRALASGVAGRAGIAGLEVTSLARLAERIASPKLAPRRPATSPVIGAAMRSAVAGSAGPFAPFVDHPATIDALTAVHAQLRTVDEHALAAIEQTTPVAGAVVELHRETTKTVHTDWYDTEDVLATATTEFADAGLGSCILYLPERLNRQQLVFLETVAAQTELTLIVGLSGVRRADQAALDVCAYFDHDPDRQERVPVADKIINATDSDDEIRCVVAELISILPETPADRVAILYANPNPYARLLHDQLAAAGIMINGPGTRTVAERALARFLRELLALIDHDLGRADLFRAIANAPVQDFDGERIPLSRWERISRSAGVVGGADWTSRLDAYLADRHAEIAAEQAADDPQTDRVERLRQDAASASALRSFVARLTQELHRAAAMTRWSDLAGWCQDLFTSLLGGERRLERLPLEERSAAATIVTVLRNAASLDPIEPDADLDRLRNLLESELSNSIPRVGRFGEGVFVGPLSSAIGLDLDVVYVVGLSEDLYPGSLHIDPLLGQRARAAADGQLPRQSDQLNRSQHWFLAALGAATTRIVSFPRGDLRRSSRRLPSRYLLGSLRELTGDHQLAATDWEQVDHVAAMQTSSSFAGRLLNAPFLATEQEWRTRAMAADLAIDDQVVSSALDLITARSGPQLTRYDGNLSGVPGLPDYGDGDRLISPTALEKYAECPHRFFVERLLGVQPIEQPEDIVVISAMEIGNFIHGCMDELVTEYDGRLPGFGEPWTPEQHRRLGALARAKAADYEHRGLTGHPRLWQAQRRQILQDLENLLVEDDRWRFERMARVAASELPFGLAGAPPVKINIGNRRVQMRGSADRIDIGLDGRIYVTDLKTGGPSRYKAISQETPFGDGDRLQLPVYGYAARQWLGDSTTPVTAMYWFVRKDLRNRLELELTDDVEKGYAETLGILLKSIRTGLFPAKAPDQPDFSWVQCPYCNPDGIGHQDARRRWERQRSDPALAELIGLIEAEAEGAGR